MRTCILIGLAAGVLAHALGFVVHGVLLGSDYAALPNLFRPEAEMERFLPFMILGHLIFGFAFAWIYFQGRKPGAAPLEQGARFGLAIAALVIVPGYLIYYTVQPLPGMLVIKQIALDSIAMVILGIVVAYLGRNVGQAGPA